MRALNKQVANISQRSLAHLSEDRPDLRLVVVESLVNRLIRLWRVLRGVSRIRARLRRVDHRTGVG